MKKLNYIILAITIFIVGCGERPIFKIEPHDETYELDQGRKIAYKANDKFETATNFEYYDGEYAVFYIYYYNSSGKGIRINPANISARLYKTTHNFNIDKPEILANALDPEIELKIIKENEKQTEAEHEGKTCMNCVFGAIGLIVAASDDDDCDNGEETVEVVADWAFNQAEIEEEREIKLEHLNNRKVFWANEVLRKTRLASGEDIGGLIYIPIDPSIKYLKLKLPFSRDAHFYNFKQYQVNK